jgi:hypothetical protein
MLQLMLLGFSVADRQLPVKSTTLPVKRHVCGENLYQVESGKS